eukprot:SAG31_NODE_931_length_10914_cov_5.629589_2_plen_117_part_00
MNKKASFISSQSQFPCSSAMYFASFIFTSVTGSLSMFSLSMFSRSRERERERDLLIHCVLLSFYSRVLNVAERKRSIDPMCTAIFLLLLAVLYLFYFYYAGSQPGETAGALKTVLR